MGKDRERERTEVSCWPFLPLTPTSGEKGILRTTEALVTAVEQDQSPGVAAFGPELSLPLDESWESQTPLTAPPGRLGLDTGVQLQKGLLRPVPKPCLFPSVIWGS